MGTNYNRQDMCAPCSPVSIGDEFKFNHRNCKVIKINNSSFDYEYINPALKNNKTNKITFIYWQNNVFYHFNTPILKGTDSPSILKNEYYKRKLKRLKQLVINY
jgi:hypothetical protein